MTEEPKNLEAFLKATGTEEDPHRFQEGYGGGAEDAIFSYSEDISPDAIDGDKWLETGASYIWKVGVLAVIDNNKCDWVYLYIGHQRKPHSSFEYIGCLHWQDGENDDMGRCLKRYVALAASIHPAMDGER